MFDREEIPVNQGTKSALATGVAGLGLLIPASMGLLVSGFPTIWCPLPTLTMMAAIPLADRRLWKAAIVVPMLCFFVWNPGLFRGQSKVPWRSYVLLIILILLSVAYFVTSWKSGLKYQGSRFTHVVCAVNATWAACLALAFGRSWKEPSSFSYNLFVHWMLFAWLAWYAFPYLGELP
jgi:hypothetical protein